MDEIIDEMIAEVSIPYRNVLNTKKKQEGNSEDNNVDQGGQKRKKDVGNVDNADAHVSKKSRGIENQRETDTKHPCISNRVNAPRKPRNLSKVICSYSIPHVWLEKVTPNTCLLYTSPSPRDLSTSRMPSSA